MRLVCDGALHASAKRHLTSTLKPQDSRLVLQGEAAALKTEMWFNEATNVIETAYPITR